MRFPHIRPYLVATLLVAAVIVVATTIAVAMGEFFHEETESVSARQAALADLLAQTVQERLAGIGGIAESAAGRMAVRDAVAADDWETAAARLSDMPSRFLVIDRLLLLDAEGTVRASQPPGAPEIGVTGLYRGGVQGVIRTRRMQVSDLVPSGGGRDANVFLLFVAVPRAAGAGADEAVLAVQVDPRRFFFWTFGLDLGPRTFVYVVDRGGRLLAHPRYDVREERIGLDDLPVVREVLAGGSGVAVSDDPIEGEPQLAAYRPVPDVGWGVVVSRSASDAFSHRDRETLLLGAALFGALAVQVGLLLLLVVAVRQLSRKERREEAFLSSIGDAVVGTDASGRVTLANAAAEAMFGWSRAEMLEKPFVDLAPMLDDAGHALPAADRPLMRAIRTKKRTQTAAATSPLRYRRRDGTLLPVGLTVTPVVAANGRVVGTISVIRDATEERRIEHAKSELVSLAAHQLKTPPVAVGWYAELLADPKLGTLTDAQREQLGKIREVAEQMTSTVNTILNVSRIELGTYAIVPAPIAPAAVVDSVLEELAPIIGDRELHVERTVPKDLPTMKADKALLRVILLNLVSNACKYTPIGGKVKVAVAAGREGFTFTVADTGYGIPKEEQKRIFSRFFRASNVVALQTEGTGLGLYIVKSVVEQAGGRIAFTSAPNIGTVFTVTFPRGGMKAKEGTRALT